MPFFLRQRYLTQGTILLQGREVPYLRANCTSERPPHLEPVGMEAAVERFRLKRADVLVASDRKTSSSPRAQSQVVPAGTSHPRFSWHANMQLPRERDKSSRAASSKTAEQNCRLHCRQNRRRPAPRRPPGPPLGQWGVCPIARGIAPCFLLRKPGQLSEAFLFFSKKSEELGRRLGARERFLRGQLTKRCRNRAKASC